MSNNKSRLSFFNHHGRNICNFYFILLSNDPGKVESNFFCYAAMTAFPI